MNDNIKIIGNGSYSLKETERKRCRFYARNVAVKGIDGPDTYACIELVDEELGVVIDRPGYEKYIDNLVESELLRGTTISKRAKAVCSFLNYLLWNTDINQINECTMTTIKKYLEYIKYKSNEDILNGSNSNKSKQTVEEDEESKKKWARKNTWIVKKEIVYRFLRNYYLANKNFLHFRYDAEKLFKVCVYTDEKGREKKYEKASGLGLRKEKRKKGREPLEKCRVLLKDYLDLLIYCALKKCPELVLAIAIQVYTGIREGELLNLTCGSYHVTKNGRGVLIESEFSFEERAPFFNEHHYKTEPGSRKNPRTQKVYPKFLDEIDKLYWEHIKRLEAAGYDVSDDAPLFRNKWGNPMTFATYNDKLKKLFYRYFLPALKESCIKQNCWPENAAYFEAYEKAFPGAHTFRHYFTMYLYSVEELKPGEVAEWRGDSDDLSFRDYIHLNRKIIREFRECTYRFQKTMVEGLNVW